MPRQCESVVTERSQDALIGSSMEHGATSIPCDLRPLDLQRELGTTATISGRKDTDHVDGHALSTVLHPMQSWFILAQGYSLGDQTQRMDCTPHIQGVSTSPPMSQSLRRWAGSLAVVGGVRLRPMALLFSSLFLIPMTTSSSTRWRDALGSHLPKEAARLQPLLALKPVTEGHRDGDSPLGTDQGVLGVKDEHDRRRMTQEGESEHGDDAQQVLKKWQDLGLPVTSAFSDDAERSLGAITSVVPHARLPADPVHTAKNSWGTLQQSL